jgi:predicted CopG family antitoxin
MARLEGFRREAGTARGYVTPTGERVSYRQYRALLKTAGRVEPLDLATLANRRVKQAAYNDVVKRAVERKRDQIEKAIEFAEEMGEDETVEDLQDELRTLKSATMKSAEFKDALQTIKRRPPKNSTPAERFEFEQSKKDALVLLGRRNGIPDWVPVGMSDRKRSGSLRKGRVAGAIRAATRGRNTRSSKG